MFIFRRQLLPVRIVIAPSPQHHLALFQYQEVFPEAFYICGKASGQMPPLTRHSDPNHKKHALRAWIFSGLDNGAVCRYSSVVDKKVFFTTSPLSTSSRFLKYLV